MKTFDPKNFLVPTIKRTTFAQRIPILNEIKKQTDNTN